MLTKDGKDVTLDELTADNYLCPAGEERDYHVVQELKQYNTRTGQRISVPLLQKYNPKMWMSIVWPCLSKQGYDLRIVHDPKVWEENYRKQLAALQAQKAEQVKQARAAERAAIKAEILAEMKAEKKSNK